jgi:hypothetical protein
VDALLPVVDGRLHGKGFRLLLLLREQEQEKVLLGLVVRNTPSLKTPFSAQQLAKGDLKHAFSLMAFVTTNQANSTKRLCSVNSLPFHSPLCLGSFNISLRYHFASAKQLQ